METDDLQFGFFFLSEWWDVRWIFQKLNWILIIPKNLKPNIDRPQKTLIQINRYKVMDIQI